MSEYRVIEYERQPTAVVRGSLTVPELPAFYGRAFATVAEALATRGLQPQGEPFAYYPTPPGATIEVEAGFPVSQPIESLGDVVPSQLPAGTIITTTHVGPYEQLEVTYRALSAWAAAHDLQLTGPMWEVYLTDPQQEPDPRSWRTDIFVYVVPAAVATTATKSA